MKIELNLLDNGLDFIIEGLKPASKIFWNNNSENTWKYSALNIFSGIELILKERLRQEHWSLIFDDVNNANENKLIKGDFISVSHNNVIKRLKGICNIRINDEPIDKLRKIRNKFEHYEAKTDINTCKQVISNAIRELIIFWDENISEYSNREQNHKVQIIKSITTEFDTYVENMLQKQSEKINNITKNNQGILVNCYNCSNLSFMVYKDKSKNFECFVCEINISREKFLRDIRESELKRLNAEHSLFEYKDYNKICPKIKVKLVAVCFQ